MNVITHKDERELDARIAEKVMGSRVVWEKNTPYAVSGEAADRSETAIPHYCTSIGSAMVVAMQLRRLGFTVKLVMDQTGTTLVLRDGSGRQICKFDNIISKLSLFICHAALIAVGDERRRNKDRRRA